MYPAPFNYYRPESLEDAIGLLTKLGDGALAMAGGQSLIPMLKLRMGTVTDVVDIGRLRGLDHIEKRGDTFHIGALARHADIAAADVAKEIPMLGDCAAGIADKQVRNMGTIGGGVAIADPSGDWPCCLRVLDADIVCTGPGGDRTVNIGDFITDSYTTVLANDELVSEIRIPVPSSSTCSAYVAFKRAASAYPSASAGVMLDLDGDVCRKARLAIGSAGSTPVASRDAEAVLEGQKPEREYLERAAAKLVEASSPPADARGSEEFKRAVLRKLVVEAAERALARSRGEEVKRGHHYAG